MPSRQRSRNVLTHERPGISPELMRSGRTWRSAGSFWRTDRAEPPGGEPDKQRGRVMKKMLFLMVVGFGGAMLVKGGHVTITPDNQVRVAGYNVPLPAAVQNSPVMGMITTLFMGQMGPVT